MNFFDILELAQLRAIHTCLEPTLESIWRQRQREYSQKFYTPLHLVETIDPLKVLEALLEENYHPSIVDEECPELLEKLYKIRDPNHSSISKEQLEELVDSVINREIKRLEKKKAPTQNTIETDIKQSESKPKSGGITFTDLEQMESASEFNKSGFDK